MVWFDLVPFTGLVTVCLLMVWAGITEGAALWHSIFM